MGKKFYIETHGCQMNAHDTEKVAAVLEGIGYEAASEAREADLLLLNTCMVREKAERKVDHRLTELRRERGGSEAIIGVLGCVAQATGERIFARRPEVRLVVGTQSIRRLPEMLEQLDSGFPRAIDIRLRREADFIELGAEARRTPHTAYITIIEGCNKFCSYCIVPFTRGRERSRGMESILAEAKSLVGCGFREAMLLGQNVNSYGISGGQSWKKSGEGPTFAGLLDRLGRESGLRRIKYTTSYPRDFTAEVVEVMDEHENLCEWIHLPAQSGSDRILRRMRRGYTRRDYMARIELIRAGRKDYAVTGDLIVGFPGETEEDFRETLSLIDEVGYDGLYIFKYSARPQTPAAAYDDTLAEEVVGERFERLEEKQAEIQKHRYERYLGREVEVLVEGKSARGAGDLKGHTRCQKVVNFPGSGLVEGELVRVRVSGVRPHSLYGEVVGREVAAKEKSWSER